MVAVSETTSMLDEALTLAGCGFAVFPLHPRTKTPATEHGFKDATTDVAQIRTWWTKTPDANIGIATGKASGGLVVIDINVDEAKGKDGRRSVPERVDNGGRNKAMISYVGKMQQMGATDETIEAYAAEFNETRMAEALDEEELTKTVDTGPSYEKGLAFGAPGSPFKGIEFIPRNEKEWSRVFAKWLYGKVCFVPEVRSVLNSLRRGGSRFWVFYSFNPPKTAMSWVNKETLARKQREDTLVWKTSYLDVASSHPEWLGGPFIEEAEYVKEYLRGLGFFLPLDDMEPWIRSWDDWMGARGDFYDYIVVSKMRAFLSDVLFDREKSGDKTISIPFGKSDCTVFRKVMSTKDTIQEFAPALRTSSQSEAFRIALQMLGDLTGFGIRYFDFDESHGYVRTATEVSSSDNSALMRNIRRHENALEGAITGIARAVIGVSRSFGEIIPDEGVMRCSTTTPSYRIRRLRRSRTWRRWASP
jgi:hypothetical protein